MSAAQPTVAQMAASIDEERRAVVELRQEAAGLIAGYGDYQRGRGFSEKTIKRRSCTLGTLARAVDPMRLVEVSGDDLEQWLGRYSAPKTRHAYRSDVRMFFRWALRRRLVNHDPTDYLDPIKLPKPLPKPLRGDVEALATVGSLRVRRMVALGLYAGLRCAEIAVLDASDVMLDADPAVLVVREGKGGKDRVVPLHPKLVELLTGLLPGPIFPNPRTGRPIMPGSVGKTITRHLRACCVDGVPHRLRHTFGTNLARATDGDILLVGSLMGHASPSTTMGYVAYANTAAAHAVAKMYGGGR